MLMDYENILDERIDPYELEVGLTSYSSLLTSFQRLRDVYETQLRRGHPSSLAKFSFAYGLIKSTKEDVHHGIVLIERECYLFQYITLF